MTTVDDILAENIDYSDLSIDPSFTLQDILKEPQDDSSDDDDIDEQYLFNQAEQKEEQKIMPYQMSQRYTKTQEMREYSNSIGMQRSGTKDLPDNQLKVKNEHPAQYQVREHRRLEDLQLLPKQQIQNMAYAQIKNVSQLFDLTESKGVGIPTCISSTGSRFLIIGTSLGNLTIFQIGTKGYKTLNIPEYTNIGQVTTVAVSRDNRYVVAGYETGVIGIWDLNGFKLIKSEIIRKVKITKVLFCCQNSENFIVNDILGYVYMYTIESKFWVSTKYQLLVNKIENRVYYDIKYTKLLSQRHIVALCSLDEVTLISIKPEIGVLEEVKRPKNIPSSKIPNCELGIIKEKDVLIVSWGKVLTVYEFNSTNYSMETVVLTNTIQHPSVIHNLQFIAKDMLITVDDSQNFRVISLLASLTENRCSVINLQCLQSQTIYQRFYKDKKGKMIKLYSNTMMNCSFDQKNKQIFFITKNAIYRGRLEKWTGIIRYMLNEQNNWEQAMKMCAELYKGNLNIFEEPFKKTKNSMSMLCEIGCIFLKQRMTEIRNKNPDQTCITAVASQARQTFQTTIQYFILIGCEEFLFQRIFHAIIKETYYYEYYDLLLQCIEPFIDNYLITRIPYYPVFQEIVSHYSSKPQLINKLVTSLDEKSLHYEDLVDICSKQKLYEALCYICAINGDYISPANKLMGAINKGMNEKGVKLIGGEQKQKIYNILKNYIQKTVKLIYPNNKPIPANKSKTPLQLMQIWISERITLQFFLQEHDDDLFTILQNMVKSLIKNNMEHYVIDLCQQLANNFQALKNDHVFEEMETNRYTKILNNLLKFMINTSLYRQIHFSNSLVKTVLQIQYKIQEKSERFLISKIFKDSLWFIDKYIIPIQIEKIRGEISIKEKKQVIEYFEDKVLPNLNINLQGYYQMIKITNLYKKDGIWTKSPELALEEGTLAYRISSNHLGNDKQQIVQHILKNNKSAPSIVQQFLDLLIKWSPEPIIVYLFEKFGVEKVNKNLKQIKDEKQQYLIVRKILKFLRKSEEQSPLIRKKASKSASVLFGMNRESESSENTKVQESIPQPKLENSILINYVNSLCKFKKQKRVFYELKKYPQNYASLALELLPITESYNLKSCQAILKQYLLHYSEAFHLYALVYQEYFNANFTKLVYCQHCHGRFMAQIFHLMLDLCFRMQKQEHWSHLIKYILTPLTKPDPLNKGRSKTRQIRIIDTIQKIYDTKSTKDHPFIHQLQDVIEATIISASREMPMSVMAAQLNKFSDLLTKIFILNCLTSTMYNSYKRVESFQINKQLMVLEYANEFGTFYKQNKIRGKSVDIRCCQCLQKFQETDQNLLIISCGHGYHKKCISGYSHLSNVINTTSSSKCKICTQKQFGDVPKINMYSYLKSTKGSEIKKIVDEDQSQNDNNRITYRCLGFDEYISKEENIFEQFCNQYQKNIREYKNY